MMNDEEASVTSPPEMMERERQLATNQHESNKRFSRDDEPKTNTHKPVDNGKNDEEEKKEQELEGLDLLKEKIKLLEEEKEKLAAEADSWKDKYYRALAEYHNYQKRMEEKIKFERQKAQEEIVLKILPIIDAIEKAKATTTIDTPVKQVIKGLEVIQRQIQQQLNRLEITEILPEKGAVFNQELHEALLSEESDEYPEGTILQVLEKGYRFNSRVLRPAKVKVSRTKQ